MRYWLASVVLTTMLEIADVSAVPAAEVRQDAPTTIDYGMVSISAATWPDFVAQAKGFNAKQNLEIETSIISPQTITSALVGNSIQIAFGATQMIAADATGGDVVAVGQGMDPAPYFLISVPSVKTIAELKGKTIALSNPVEAYTEAIRIILRKSGLDPEKDVTFLFGPGSNQRVAALSTQAVQAGLLVPPEDLPLVEKGYHRLVFMPDYFPHLALSVVAVKRGWADANAGVLRRFLEARAEGIRWLYEPANKQEALRILEDETHSSKPAAEESYDVLLTKMHIFPSNGCIETEGLANTEKMMDQLHQLQGPAPPLTKIASTEWCPK